jgi:hypothetical protein
MVGCTCHPSDGIKQKKKNGRITVQATLGKKRDLSLKITRAKRAGGMAEAVEHLPCNCGVLSLTPSKYCREGRGVRGRERKQFYIQ